MVLLWLLVQGSQRLASEGRSTVATLFQLEDVTMAKYSRTAPSHPTSVDVLIHRTQKFRRKGEFRKALQAIREACLMEEQSAWLWTLYGFILTQRHRISEARQAYRHALWLRKASGDEARARSTQLLLDNLELTSAVALAQPSGGRGSAEGSSFQMSAFL